MGMNDNDLPSGSTTEVRAKEGSARGIKKPIIHTEGKFRRKTWHCVQCMSVENRKEGNKIIPMQL
jgi:hypothetical protein